MAEKYGFFDSTSGDERTYDAQAFTDYFSTLVTTGVMKGIASELAVDTMGNNLLTIVGTGVAFLEGRYYENDSLLELTHDPEGLGLNRIDRIVVRLDLNTDKRSVRAIVKKGLASTTPIAPSLQRDDLIYEISLAQVFIVGGQTYIGVEDITDEREDESVCGWAGSNILPNFDEGSIGQPNGIATLDDTGNVPTEQLGNVPLPQDASLNKKGIVQLNDDVDSNSTTQAATPNAIKSLYDRIGGQNKVDIGGVSASGLIGQNAINISQGAGARGVKSIVVGNGALATGLLSAALGNGASSTNDGVGVIGGDDYSSGDTDHWQIPGSLNVSGTKNFEIPHPHPDKKATHRIRHGAVESPTEGDTLYRYTVIASKENDTQNINLPDYFIYLNKDVQIFVTPQGHFGNGYGELNRQTEQLEIHCQYEGEYNVLVIGTRNDDNVQDWSIKGVEREVGESWNSETYSFEVKEIIEVQEIREVIA